uniref:zinc finger protein 346-like n=1 Tax=Erigeron canadensis TaxID=72917 RepID=UPI001CB9888F|nr:zinc finger protein 346-like [Erigeron canadensis]
MQPPNPADAYGHHHPQEYFTFFPTTPNPNPYHQLQSQPADPTPPGVDSYPTTHGAASASYNAHYYTYSNTVAQHWLAAGGLQYVSGTTVPQDSSQQILPAMPTYSTWTNPNPTAKPRGPWKKISKKTKIVQSAWCELCRTECTTIDVLYKHRSGKKHLKNLEKLMQATSAASTSASTPVNPAVPSNPIIGPPEKPKKGKSGTKKKAETPEDLEKKRRKVLEGGAAANAVRICQICNVVCNSDTVFRYHLTGQKHASMLKKQQQAGVV